MILFQSDISGNTPLLVTSSSAYEAQHDNVVLACVYPATDFKSQESDQACLEPTFYCPASYTCQNSTSLIPVCHSNTMPCGNSTFCYDYIDDLPYTSDDMAKQLDLEYNLGGIIFFYFIAVIAIIVVLIILAVIGAFRNRIKWIPEGAEAENTAESKPLSGSGPY